MPSIAEPLHVSLVLQQQTPVTAASDAAVLTPTLRQGLCGCHLRRASLRGLTHEPGGRVTSRTSSRSVDTGGVPDVPGVPSEPTTPPMWCSITPASADSRSGSYIGTCLNLNALLCDGLQTSTGVRDILKMLHM